MARLSRTANAKIHASTKLVPGDEWMIEKDYLKPIMDYFPP
jgi:hypothetical protein